MILQQLITGVSIGSVYALLAVGYALVFSVFNFSNFGFGPVMMLGGIRCTVRHRTDPHGVVSRHPGCTGRGGRYLTPDGGDDLPPHAPEKGFESVSDDRGSGNQHLCSQLLYPALGRRGAPVSIRLGQSRDPYRQYRHSQGRTFWPRFYPSSC